VIQSGIVRFKPVSRQEPPRSIATAEVFPEG
jgi:hypothetical protein